MKKYILLIFLFALAFGLNLLAPNILSHLNKFGEPGNVIISTFWCIALILGFGWMSTEISKDTIFPSFSIQLLISIILHDALTPLSSNITLIIVICTVLAAIILKSGGDELVRKHFAKIAFPTIMIAIVGYLITFFVSLILFYCSGLLELKAAALLSAIIGSTDPAALIPTLKKLKFKSRYARLSDISIAESALNDAVGAIFTGAIIIIFSTTNNTPISSINELSFRLVSIGNLLNLGEQFLFGTIAGIIGGGIMYLYEKRIHNSSESAHDFAALLFVPIFSFLLATIMHGNGFLAAFISGLLSNYNYSNNKFHRTLNNMETQIESIAKPVIFMMIGPFIGIKDLFEFAVVGFAISMLFIIIARPLAVFISLLPTQISFKEKAFLCIIRETGVIPVVLAVITISQFPDLKMLIPITTWVVIWTLVILPIVTPFWARTCKVVIENKKTD